MRRLFRLFTGATQKEIDKFYKAGEECMAQENWAAAKENFLEVIRLYPNCMSVLYKLVEVDEKLAQQDQKTVTTISNNRTSSKSK